MYRIFIFLLFLLISISCKSQEIENIVISNSDDFSNKSYSQAYNAYLNNLEKEKIHKTTKVLYNKKVYQFEDFKNDIGFNDKLNVTIIKDSISISKYKIKDCKVLIIAEKK